MNCRIKCLPLIQEAADSRFRRGFEDGGFRKPSPNLPLIQEAADSQFGRGFEDGGFRKPSSTLPLGRSEADLSKVMGALWDWTLEIQEDGDGEGTDDVALCSGYCLDRENSIICPNLPSVLPDNDDTFHMVYYLWFSPFGCGENWDVAVVDRVGPCKFIIPCRFGGTAHSRQFYTSGIGPVYPVPGRVIVAKECTQPGGGVEENPGFMRTVAHELGHATGLPFDNGPHPDLYGTEELCETTLTSILQNWDLEPGHEYCKEAYIEEFADSVSSEEPPAPTDNTNIMWFSQCNALDKWIRENQLPWD